MNSNVISSALKKLRKEHGLTQVDLAMKSGVGLNFVRELEQGKATVRTGSSKEGEMSKALIQYKGKAAGILKETDEGYEFQYDNEYLADETSKPVSLTLPLSVKPYKSTVLFPFFDGLIPEGWLLDVALRNTDISELDRFSLLLLCCKDCIGAVSVIPIKEDGDE